MVLHPNVPCEDRHTGSSEEETIGEYYKSGYFPVVLVPL
jgi:hypothetical protein